VITLVVIAFWVEPSVFWLLGAPRYTALYVPRACYRDSVGGWSFLAPH
jgi:hypothetical protein